MKYVAIALFMLVFIVFTVTGTWLWQGAGNRGTSFSDRINLKPQTHKVTEVVQRLQKLNQALKGWGNDSGARPFKLPLIAESPDATGPVIKQPKVAASVTAPLPKHDVSMIYRSANMQRAVIDGHYMAPGDKLPDGAMLVAIRSGSVVLNERGRRRHIQAPVNSVGSVR